MTTTEQVVLSSETFADNAPEDFGTLVSNQPEPAYFVEQPYYNLDNSESITIKIPKNTRHTNNVKRLGIWCSGGCDSTSLLYLLAKTIQDHNLDLYIQPMSVRRQRPWNPVKASAVIQKVTEILNFDRMLPHQIYYPPKSDPHQTEWQEFQDKDKINKKTGVWHVLFDGLTSNPPADVQPYSNQEEHRRGDNIKKEIESVCGAHMRPLYLIDKRFVADIFRQFNLINSLLPVTWSCEGTVEASCNFTIHCEECWWCWERQWAFGRL